MRTRIPAIIETVGSTTIQTVNYNPPVGSTGIPTLVFTNQSGSANTFTVYVNDGASNIKLQSKTIPNGKIWRVFSLSDVTLQNSYSVKIQGTAQPYNYFFSVSESNY